MLSEHQYPYRQAEPVIRLRSPARPRLVEGAEGQNLGASVGITLCTVFLGHSIQIGHAEIGERFRVDSLPLSWRAFPKAAVEWLVVVVAASAGWALVLEE